MWQRFGVLASNALEFDKLYGNQETGAVPGDAQPSQYWVALRFDPQGNIVGVGLSGTGSVVGSSCWTSLALAG